MPSQIEVPCPLLPSPELVNCNVLNQPIDPVPNLSLFMQLAQTILKSPMISPRNPPLKFEFTREAAQANWDVIQQYESLSKMIHLNPTSTIAYGSEFRPTRILRHLLKSHKSWPKLKSMLENGSKFPLTNLSESITRQDLEEAFRYGNHKSAKNNSKVLLQHLQKELSKGWIIPLLPQHAFQLANASLAPLGVVTQSTINDRGEVVSSNRVTHDLSFPGKVSGESVNSRTRMDELEPCEYGKMLSRTIHYIVALRLKYPNLPIALQKIDFKSAYRRQHLNAETAVQCLSCIELDGEKYVMLNLRLSFGGSACPAEWCVISETMTDLANRILNDESWNPDQISASLIEKVPKSSLLEPEIPFKEGKEMIVEIPIEQWGKADVYIDDVCTVGILSSNSAESRLRNGVLLAMDLMGRPIAPTEPLPRDPMPSMDKLLSEAGLEEVKCLLGWTLNTRSLLISLHTEKYNQWLQGIQDVIRASGRTTKKELEVILGRLNHAASILPIARHFLCRISYATYSAEYYKPVRLNKSAIRDLELWEVMLKHLHTGVSMNLLTMRPPNIIIWTDACEHGLGGISYPRGRAWRYSIPPDMMHRAHINILEFIAILTGIWLEIIEEATKPEDCILAFGDNTSAISWIYRSKFRGDHEPEPIFQAKLSIARKIAKLSIESELRLYNKWLPGESNQVADHLSRTRKLRDISPSTRDRIIYLQSAAKSAQSSATSSRYKRFGDTTWSKWTSFLNSIGIMDDHFLESFTRRHKNQIISLFAQDLRMGQNSGKINGTKGLVAGSIQNTISSLAQTFMENGLSDPRIADNNKVSHLLSKQIASFKAEDPAERRQKAVPLSVIKRVMELQASSDDPLAEACSQLIVGAFFFAMRSCEYSKTTGPKESTSTKLLSIGNIRFFKNRKIIKHSDPKLEDADIVSITFESQKNKEKYQTISMHRAPGSKMFNLCPVLCWASIVRRIRSYPSSRDSSPVNMYRSKAGKLLSVTSTQIRTKLRAAAVTIGHDELGFTASEIGCHSLRSGGAMAMYLAKVPITTIQLIGRWKSDAFMRYIREQVDCFTSNISSEMTRTKSFYTIPDKEFASELQKLDISENGPPMKPACPVFHPLVL